MKSVFHLLSVTALFLFALMSNSESYSTIESLTEVVAQESTIIRGIRELHRRRLTELDKIQRKIEFFDQEQKAALENVDDYLNNPINAYKLIKRMVVDWNEIHDFIWFGNTTNGFAEAFKSHIKSPSESDLHDAIRGLNSVEPGTDGAGGEIIYGSKMTGEECYEVGIRLYDEHDFVGALPWLQQALEKLRDSEQFNDLIRLDILEYIAYSQYMLGDVVEATLTMEQVLDTPVVNSTVAEAKAYFLTNGNDFRPKIVHEEPHYIDL